MSSRTEREICLRRLRTFLDPYAKASTVAGLIRVTFNVALYAIGTTAVVVMPAAAKPAASLLLALVVSRLFVLGHDAGHNALVTSKRGNAWLGRFLMLPSYTAFSLWKAGHNIGHHGFAGLRGRDPAWAPLSPTEYRARAPWRRWLYRVQRTWWGAGVYYGCSIWFQQLLFPNGPQRPEFVRDSWSAIFFLFGQVTLYAILGKLTDQPIWALIVFGIVLPFFVFLQLAGMVFYIQHTNETLRWYDDPKTWRSSWADLFGANSSTLPWRIDLLLHGAMYHTAHHLHVGIPCYHLPAAQKALQECYPSLVPDRRRVTWRRYIDITRNCQLYDGFSHRWVTFAEASASAFGKSCVYKGDMV